MDISHPSFELEYSAYVDSTSVYPRKNLLETIKRLYSFPCLSSKEEVEQLKVDLSKAFYDKSLIIQLGDCVELFGDCHESHVKTRLDFIDSIASYMELMSKKEVICFGRMAGQYAKPRSQIFEDLNGQKMYSFMGEMINGFEDNQEDRIPNPKRMLWAYYAAQKTHNWMKAYSTRKVYSAHEAYNLIYENALSRTIDGEKYNLSSPFQWLGMRSTFLGSSHVDFYKQIENPVGIKIGPSMDALSLNKLLLSLNPLNEAGKITLITRLGHNKVSEKLPSLVSSVVKNNHKVIWLCDPMHANTVKNRHQLKTRPVSFIKKEIYDTIDVHKTFGTYLSGLHLESSPDPIQECCDDELMAHEIKDSHQYTTKCDPRLNYEQTLKVVRYFLNYQFL